MSKNQQSNSALEAARKQVDEVQGIMAANVEKVLEREGKLGQLGERAERLQEGSDQFQKATVRIKRKMWWDNMKMKLIIGGVAAVIIIIIIIVAST